MRVSSDVALHPVEARGDDRHAEISIAGRRTGLILDGRVLEAAVQCAPGRLLFVTDDVPFEEMLSIYLIDDAGHALLDSARIGGMYATGSFTDLTLAPPATVHFRFIDDAQWSVRVLDQPQTAMPWWPDARGVSRGRRFRRYFEITSRPL